MRKKSSWAAIVGAVIAGAFGGSLAVGSVNLAVADGARSNGALSVSASPISKSGPYQPISATRVFTTSGDGVRAGSPQTIKIAGVASDATAATITIRAFHASQAATLTVSAGGEQIPGGSTMNYPAKLSHTTTTTVKLDSLRQLKFSVTAGTVKLAVDLHGYFRPTYSIVGPNDVSSWGQVSPSGAVVGVPYPDTLSMTSKRMSAGSYFVSFPGLSVIKNGRYNVQVTPQWDSGLGRPAVCNVSKPESGSYNFIVKCFGLDGVARDVGFLASVSG